AASNNLPRPAHPAAPPPPDAGEGENGVDSRGRPGYGGCPGSLCARGRPHVPRPMVNCAVRRRPRPFRPRRRSAAGRGRTLLLVLEPGSPTQLLRPPGDDRPAHPGLDGGAGALGLRRPTAGVPPVSGPARGPGAAGAPPADAGGGGPGAGVPLRRRADDARRPFGVFLGVLPRLAGGRVPPALPRRTRLAHADPVTPVC